MTKSKCQNKFNPKGWTFLYLLKEESKIQMINIKMSVLLFVICHLCFVSWNYSAFAQEKEEQEPVVVNGDRVEYLEDLHQAIGVGHVVITYQNMKLTCDKIVVFVDTKDAYAEGKVILTQAGDTFSGERMNYNFDTKRGTMIDSKMVVKQWYGAGEQVDKNSDKKFMMYNGYVTTCDLPNPHYRIQGSKISIYLKDRIIIHNAVMLVGNFPIFYFPYYSHSLNDDKSIFTIIPGRKKEWGSYVLTSWRIFKDEQSHANIHLDEREKRGMAGGFDYFYNTTDFGQGKLSTYFVDDKNGQKPIAQRSTEQRNRVQLKHQWQVSPDTQAILEYHKYSDVNFIKDFFRREYDIDNQPASYVSVIKTKPEYTLSFYARQQANHFETVIEKMPEVLLDVKNTQFKETDFYYKGQQTFSQFNRKYGEQNTTDDLTRFDTYNQISYVKKVLGWLNLSPYIGMRDTYYSKDINGNDHLFRTIAYSGLDVSTKFYRAFDIETNFWNLDIHKLRHIITPTINYSYINDPSTHSYDLTNFDAIDSITRTNAAIFSLENKLQTKRPTGKNKKLENVDLLTFILSTNYDFTARQMTNFTNVTGDLELTPYPWLRLESDANYNTRTRGFDTVNEDLVITKAKWQLGLGNRYQRNTSEELTSGLTYQLNSKWKLATYERYYFKKVETGADGVAVKKINLLKEQEYTVTRDLHCWWLDLTYNLKRGEGGTFWFIFRLKAFPEIPFKFKASYSPPKQPPAQNMVSY